MSNIEHTIHPAPGSVVRQVPPIKLRHSSESRPVPVHEPSGKQEPERPDTAREVLQRVAERALENPPRDIQKLTASAAKFLLINLEPAMRLAEELREASMNRSGHSMAELLMPDRQNQAMTLLTDQPR